MSFYFLDFNYIDPDVVSNSYVSSAQAAFPVVNVYNKQRRSKIWRSDGYWEIVSGDNTIIFRESVGVDLTATIVAGNYTSTTSFLTAIKTALELTGASTYTVTEDTTTGKIKIASDGAGGGGILQLMWTDPLSADMAGILGYDTASNDTGALTYTADVLRIHTSEWIKWDFGLSSNPKAFVLIGARNRAIPISPSSTIKLQGNETDIWTSPTYETTITYDDEVMVEIDTAGLATVPLRYWRLDILDTDNPLGYVEIGALYLGDLTTTVRGQPQFPFTKLPVDRSETVFSEGGQSFSDIREKTVRFQAEWYGLTVAENEALLDIFERYGTGVPIFVSFDPMQAWSSMSNKQVRYCKFLDAPNSTIESPGNFKMSMNFEETL